MKKLLFPVLLVLLTTVTSTLAKEDLETGASHHPGYGFSFSNGFPSFADFGVGGGRGGDFSSWRPFTPRSGFRGMNPYQQEGYMGSHQHKRYHHNTPHMESSPPPHYMEHQPKYQHHHRPPPPRPLIHREHVHVHHIHKHNVHKHDVHRHHVHVPIYHNDAKHVHTVSESHKNKYNVKEYNKHAQPQVEEKHVWAKPIYAGTAWGWEGQSGAGTSEDNSGTEYQE